ncbi:hypothetical protein BDB00DRAFT_925577 [Zychaea mexicana]|uniref:uncharacterized protein n=1 Tax=Zychaea mexicana TaxID=64656 RepID=UPI0022FE55A9|nr:uncharacterized protein BDB00DRAFT_925577 [Zychaea mexicana]KAI9497892.1 hypothetical protein BDB00DRAFT_925577 [Zychaea mexicana]
MDKTDAFATSLAATQIPHHCYLTRACDLPDDALLTQLRTYLKSSVRTYRATNLRKLQEGPNTGVLMSACRRSLELGPTFFLAIDMYQSCNTGMFGQVNLSYITMTFRKRNHLLRWRMGWLSVERIQCTNCNNNHTSHHHLIECLDIAYQLDLPSDAAPNPIDHLFNKLPPLEQLDKIFHPDLNDDIPDDPELGLQLFVGWLTAPPPILPPALAATSTLLNTAL